MGRVVRSTNFFTLISDLEFFGENRRRMTRNYALRHPRLVHSIDITWRFQKNGQNGEKKTFVRSFDNADLCAVSALLRIAQRWIDLRLSGQHPLAVFTTDGTVSGDVEFIRASHINAALQSAATAVYKIKKPEDLARFTSHSIRVGACVALHAAGMTEMDIQHALRWRSNSFWNYLRNLPCQSQRTSQGVQRFQPHRLFMSPSAGAAAA